MKAHLFLRFLYISPKSKELWKSLRDVSFQFEEFIRMSSTILQISLVSRQSRPGLLNGVGVGGGGGVGGSQSYLSHKTGGIVNNGHSFYSAMHPGDGGSVAGGLDGDSQDTYFKHPHLQVNLFSLISSGS